MKPFMSLNLTDSQSGKVAEPGELSRMLPLLRFRPGYPTKVLALFDNEIIVGSRWFRRHLEVGEFMDGTLPPSWRSSRIAPENVLNVTIIEPGSRPLSDQSWRFLIQTRAGAHRFAFNGDDGQQVFRYFQQKFPDSLIVRAGEWAHFTWRFKASLGWLVLMTLIFCIASFALRMTSSEDQPALLNTVYGFALFMWFLIAALPRVFYKTGFHSLPESGFLHSLHKLNESLWPKINDPAQLRLVGWWLKFLVVVWCCFCLFWMENQPWFNSLTDRATSTSQIYLLLYSPALFLNYWGYRMCRAARKLGRVSGVGAEILYLRAFDEDQMITLQPRSWLARFLGVLGGNSGIGGSTQAARFRSPIFLLLHLHPVRFVRMFLNKGADTSEEVITSFFSRFGKVMAAGQPDERLAPPGAERFYAENKPWQQVITEHLERAKIVIIQPGISMGLRWEIIKTFETVEPQRILLNLAGFWRYPGTYDVFLTILPDHIRAKMPPEVPYLGRPAFLYFDKDWNAHLQLISYRSPLLWLFLGDVVDLEYTLRPFVRSVNGTTTPSPRPPVRHLLHTAVAWVLIVVSYSILNLLLLIGGSGSPAYRLDQQARLRYTYPTESRDAAALDALRYVPPVEYKGKKVPYTIQIPYHWRQVELAKGTQGIDYVFGVDEPMSIIAIMGVRGRDIPNLASVTEVGLREFKRYQKKRVDQVKLIQNYAWQNWAAARFEVRLKTGEVVERLLCVYLGRRSTVYLVGTIVNNDSSVSNYGFYLSLIQETLPSIRVND